ncbi:MAG TPA: bifunctional UDP-N-acetylglucosamine diphosphorylase/glucosamine-1-phosphate N-acetyltransferase GlmU [Terracidiphilus sp.]|nr:bifunctional UDP-N-acetylglucosamine diphosphorylase/glucosamine-1-phosphate N-acetyltransferase GlmU [Terracidiphilus sp.]
MTSQTECVAEISRQTVPASDAALAIVIMAAGKGTRLKSKRPKVLHEIGGKPLLAHVIAAATTLVPADRVYVVVGHEAGRVREAVASSGVRFVEQTEQRGTGHAIQCARQAMAGFDSILVLSGDVPLIRPETIERLWEFHQAQRAAMTLLTTTPADASGYGRVLRTAPGGPEVEAIIEQKALTAEQHRIGEINAGIYAFQTAPLFAQIGALQAENAHAELYLTDMARLLRDAGERVVAVEAPDPTEVLGANTLAELASLDAALRDANARRLMASGVTIFRPETCIIDSEVKVASDTVIEPFVQLLGTTRIGCDCRIRSYTVVRNCALGDSVEVLPHCVLDSSTIGAGARLGPFANLRPGSEVGENVHIGNFVELKKTRLGKGAKANHFAYLGDTEIGARCNIGAGTIVCNYDGTNKYQTHIGEGVFVGSNSTLVAPVTLEDGAYIGAASCITKDVPADALAVGRARQVTKEGWAAVRRKRRQEGSPKKAGE